MMQLDNVCDRICDDIAEVLFSMKPATKVAAFVAARATQDVAAAFYHAAGDPANPRWREAIGSLGRFIDLSKRSLNLETMEPMRELVAFVDENADLLAA